MGKGFPWKMGETWGKPQFFVDKLRFSLWKIKSSMASKKVSSCECLGEIFKILHGSMRRLRFAWKSKRFANPPNSSFSFKTTAFLMLFWGSVILTCSYFSSCYPPSSQHFPSISWDLHRVPPCTARVAGGPIPRTETQRKSSKHCSIPRKEWWFLGGGLNEAYNDLFIYPSIHPSILSILSKDYIYIWYPGTYLLITLIGIHVVWWLIYMLGVWYVEIWITEMGTGHH